MKTQDVHQVKFHRSSLSASSQSKNCSTSSSSPPAYTTTAASGGSRYPDGEGWRGAGHRLYSSKMHDFFEFTNVRKDSRLSQHTVDCNKNLYSFRCHQICSLLFFETVDSFTDHTYIGQRVTCVIDSVNKTCSVRSALFLK